MLSAKHVVQCGRKVKLILKCLRSSKKSSLLCVKWYKSNKQLLWWLLGDTLKAVYVSRVISAEKRLKGAQKKSTLVVFAVLIL